MRKDILDKGFVVLVDHMGSDDSIIEAARVSYQKGGKSTDRDLMRYMFRNHHTSPFEQCEIQLHVKLPIFVVRQWQRHRTWSYSEISGRYSEMKDEMYIPSELRLQSKSNKQGSEAGFVDSSLHLANMDANYEDTFEEYNTQLELGVAKELARIALPLSLYTEMYAKVNLHNLMRFLGLRMDSHAQYEIRVYAEAIYELVKDIFPLAMEAFDDYHPLRGGMLLSQAEIIALRDMMNPKIVNGHVSDNKREQGEWEEKLKRILGYE